mgnify:CR=1 FL=1
MEVIIICHTVGYACDVELEGFNAPIRFYFETMDQRRIFLKLIRKYTRATIRKGRPVGVTHYDIDASKMNVIYYFGTRIAEMVYA